MSKKDWTIREGLFELRTLICFCALKGLGSSLFVRFFITKVSDCNSSSCLGLNTSYSDAIGTSWRRCSLWFNSNMGFSVVPHYGVPHIGGFLRKYTRTSCPPSNQSTVASSDFPTVSSR
jgi:hypothetical protein